MQQNDINSGSVIIFTSSQQNQICVGIIGDPAQVMTHIEKFALGCANSVIAIQARNEVSKIITPIPAATYIRIETMPQSVSSYTINSVLALQNANTIELHLVVRKETGWIRTNIRHRTHYIGTITIIPATDGTLDTFSKQRSGEVYDEIQRTRSEISVLERKLAELDTTNRCVVGELHESRDQCRELHVRCVKTEESLESEQKIVDALERKCDRLLQHMRAQVGIDCALAIFNEEESAPKHVKMCYEKP